MLSKLGQPLSRLLAKPNVAGDSLVERMRSTTFALLGLTTAVGLGLVAFVSHQGWPDFLTSPIPGLPIERVDDGTVAARPPVAAHAVTVATRAGKAAPRLTRSGPPAAEPAGSGLSGSHLVAAPPASQPGSGGGQPSGQGAPPTGQPSSPAPAPVVAPTPAAAPNPVTKPASASTPASTSAPVTTSTSPPSDSPAKGPTGHGKGNAYGKDEGSSPSKSKTYHPESHAPPAPTKPPAPIEPPAPVSEDGSGEVEPAPSTDEKPDGHGNGYGHAYGHYGK